MLIVGYIFAILIGVTLGLVGSGGSILTVPVFVYILGIDPSLATTYSLFAIAISSSVGSIRNLALKEVDLRKVLDFGLPSILMVFIVRQFVLPLIPKEFYIGDWVIHQNVVLMIFFSLIMILSAYRMIKGNLGEVKTAKNAPRYLMVLQGLILGAITGIVGAGGGFLIIPALMNFYGMGIIRAVATSLFIIALNSLFGLAGDLEKIALFDWSVLTPYTILLILGMFVGFYVCRFFKKEQLKNFLGYLILIIGIYILIRELIHL